MSRIITVTSGKGGVGKTNISVNLALHLADEGYRTCLFDADMGLANVDILLGLNHDLSLEDVLSEKKKISEVMITDFMGIDIVPGSSGVQRMADLKPEDLNSLADALSGLEDYDFLVVDTSAGIAKSVISFCMASSEILLVVTPEPTSLTDGYSLLKMLSLNGFNGSVMVAINQCRSIEVSGAVFSKFRAVVEKYLPIKILPAGTILADDHVPEAVKKQKPFISLFPASNAAKGIKNIGRHLLKKNRTEFSEYGQEAFWAKCFKLFTSPLQLAATRPAKKTPSPEKAANKKSDPVQLNPDKERKILQAQGSLSTQSTMPASVAAPPATEALPQDIPLILEKLTQGITNISSELSAIRGILERGSMNSGQGLSREKVYANK
jgi:flagellar biosynthesis protein FlhG